MSEKTTSTSENTEGNAGVTDPEIVKWVGGPDSGTGAYIGLDADGGEVDMMFPDEFES